MYSNHVHTINDLITKALAVFIGTLLERSGWNWWSVRMNVHVSSCYFSYWFLKIYVLRKHAPKLCINYFRHHNNRTLISKRVILHSFAFWQIMMRNAQPIQHNENTKLFFYTNKRNPDVINFVILLFGANTH